jgi:hypothetical protein
MGTPTLENPGNRWKNPDFWVIPENSHPEYAFYASNTAQVHEAQQNKGRT